MKVKKALSLLIVCLFFVGCVSIQEATKTPEQKVLLARQELNTLLVEYIQIQDRFDYVKQGRFKVFFKSADLLLDQQERNLSSGGDIDTTEYDQWLEIKSEIIKLLLEDE